MIMQKRRHTCLLILVVIRSFGDFIPMSGCAVKKIQNHRYYETKRGENNHYHDSLGDIAKLKSENGISRLSHEDVDANLTAGTRDVRDAMTLKDGEKSDDREDDYRFMENVALRNSQQIDWKRNNKFRELKNFALKLKRTNSIDHKDSLLLQALQNHRHHHHHRPSKNKYEVIGGLAKPSENNQNSFHSTPVVMNHLSEKQESMDGGTNQHDRQADPLLSCVEAFCSRSDWEEEEYLECISANCMPAVIISGKRDLKKFKNEPGEPSKCLWISRRENDFNYDDDSNISLMTSRDDWIGRKFQDSLAKRRQQNDDVIGYKYDDAVRIDKNVLRTGETDDDDHYEDDGEISKFPLKMKELLKYLLLHVQQQTDVEQTINRMRRNKEQYTEPHVTNIMNQQHNKTTSHNRQQHGDDGLDQEFSKQSSGPTAIWNKVHGNPTRLSKRGFNDVYNTCVQSNCGQGGSRGLVYYSCIQHHCG